MTSLTQFLKTWITENGDMPFATFMHYALYHPVFGYYTAGPLPIGPAGDFITAPTLSPLFAKTFASAFLPYLHNIPHPTCLELGAGSGRFCVDVLIELEKLGHLPDTYYILEVSGNLCAHQEALIKTEIPHLAHRVQWLSAWPTKPFQGVVFANEVLDAMPVERFFKIGPDAYARMFVTLDKTGHFKACAKACDNALLLTHLHEHLSFLPYPYQSEVNLFITPWIQAINDCLEKGAVFIVDYGFLRETYYHPDRHQGTLMCHYRHTAHPDPFIHIGEQDITAHVDFTHVGDAAEAAGFRVDNFSSQAAFLLANGLLTHVPDIEVDTKTRLLATQAIKKLVNPEEMGELFKVMVLKK